MPGTSVLYQASPQRGLAWAQVFAAQAPEFSFKIWPDHDELATTEYLIAWIPDRTLLQRLPRLKVLFSLGAGVDQLDLASIAPGVRIVRLIDPGIAQGMTEYVALSVLALHRQWPDYWQQQQHEQWHELPGRLARERRVGIMGPGVLGRAALDILRPFGFPLRTWGRSAIQLPGVDCFAGRAQLPEFLSGCDIVVCLLPLTPETRGIMNRDFFQALPPGAAVINAGRGGHLDAEALCQALDAGHLSAAILDVTDPEPLPAGHALWRHPRVFVTCHTAAQTLPQSAAPVVIENLRRDGRGEPLHGEIDRSRGY